MNPKPKPKLEPLNGQRFSRVDLKRAKARLFPSASGGARPLFKRRVVALVWLLLCLAIMPARAQVTNNSVFISQVITDPFFGDYVMVAANHFPGFEFRIDYSLDMAEWKTLTWWGCNLSDEVRTTSANFPARLASVAFFRSVNSFCFPIELAPAEDKDKAQRFLDFIADPFGQVGGGQ